MTLVPGKVNIFTDFSFLTDSQLKNLSPILSFHWDGLRTDAIFANQANPHSPFLITADPSEADFFVLPMHWSYYLWNDKAKMDDAIRLAELARSLKKKIVIWFKGDLVPVIPFDNAIVFLPGAIRSRAAEFQRAGPVFIYDPELIGSRNGTPQYREKSDRPSVGFCGYAAAGAPKMTWSVFKATQLNLASRYGRYEFSEVPIMPATLLRAKALKLLSRHPHVDSNFVIRRRYTNLNAGNASERKEAETAFFANIHENDYTLCVRGYGNWSYRFYQTLACGRIPIFVDTDCFLPLPDLDWKKYCVWVDVSELKYIGEKVADFHSSLSSSDFLERQMSCRKLWEEYLTPDGFFRRAFTSLV